MGYNILATSDAEEKLGGQPFDNHSRAYTGSADDAWLNQAVQRYTAAPAAVKALRAYQTTGQLYVPLVGLHTRGDEIVPYAHLAHYQEKVTAARRGAFFKAVTVERYGHCNFTSAEIQDALDQMIGMANIPRPVIQITPTPTAAPATAAAPASTSILQAPTSATPAARTPAPEANHPATSLWDRLLQWLEALVKL